jgi:hypothetical protein
MVTDAAMLWTLGAVGLCGFAVAFRYRVPMVVAVSMAGGPFLFALGLSTGRSGLSAALVAVAGLFIFQLAYFLGVVAVCLVRGVATKRDRPAGAFPLMGDSRRPR